MMMWTKNLKTSEEKERFENTLRGSKIVLERLTQMLDEEQTGIDQFEMTTASYNSPNWAEKQAHKNGQRAMLRKIKLLINLDQQKD